jgi:hypothetical protein
MSVQEREEKREERVCVERELNQAGQVESPRLSVFGRFCPDWRAVRGALFKALPLLFFFSLHLFGYS